jgi:ERCC4-type nuclease
MIREILEDLDIQNELFGFSAKEKAQRAEIVAKVKKDKPTDPSGIFILLQKLASTGNEMAKKLLHDVGSDKSYVKSFIRKYS